MLHRETLVNMPEDNHSFLTGNNAIYLAELYAKYLKNPSNVDESWQSFFGSLNDREAEVLYDLFGASWAPRTFDDGDNSHSSNTAKNTHSVSDVTPVNMPTESEHTDVSIQSATRDSIRALMIIRSHRVRGHLAADLDPLGIEKPGYHPELDPKTYGFEESDMDRSIFIDGVLGMEFASMREIIHVLRETYSKHLTFEFMHIQDTDQKEWIENRVEQDSVVRNFSTEERHNIYNMLGRADTFERYLHKKFPGAKRFGLEGAESLIPALEQVLIRAEHHGVREVLFGMAHRGRLNVLTNIIGKPYEDVFYEFDAEAKLADDVQGSGDVKYHLGVSVDREINGTKMHLSLTPNPSHLEAVDPVVVGKVRAKQDHEGDTDRSKIMGILLHGDAAFSGQGLVAETLALSDLDGYNSGGTLHLIINNQIGFTTNPNQSRSSPYCSDMAKMIQAPIIHVNGDDPEAVVYAAKFCMDFKHKFKQDVVLDIICYRRHGHNEMDEPAFTQPLMYKNIRSRPSTFDIYTERLLKEGTIDDGSAKQISSQVESELADAQERASSREHKEPDWLKGRWADFEIVNRNNRDGLTACSDADLQNVGRALSQVPDSFNLNSKLRRFLKAREDMFSSGEGIDWATAEALAFGTLLTEGHGVRLSGQDCGRGTFSHRHSVFTDQETEEKFTPLNNIQENQAFYEVIDSPLAEQSVLGYEYGYSASEPDKLVMWEAQFGDFANGAQMIIDQFVMSGEVKWFRMSGLVLLLPHGMEGQGPEHSSARLERFLQMCAEDNVQVANCTTPANYFHILRRQLKRSVRKPLILMTPKSLLRHKKAVSSLADMSSGSEFMRVIPEVETSIRNSANINRIIICSGKVYYDLLENRQEQGLDDAQIIRLEQLYPFPENHLKDILRQHPNAAVIWCQEESKNNGAWTFVDRRLESVLRDLGYDHSRPLYAGRSEAASPATGYAKQHKLEQEKLIADAFTLAPDKP